MSLPYAAECSTRTASEWDSGEMLFKRFALRLPMTAIYLPPLGDLAIVPGSRASRKLPVRPSD
jgi:hypothetical protein